MSECDKLAANAEARVTVITALIPAVDEPDIDQTVRSLLSQTRPPEQIVVAWNNHTSTATADAVARVADPRVRLLDLGQITGRKAGALNAALDSVPADHDVLVVDADTVMAAEFLEVACAMLSHDQGLGAVGGVFYGQSPRGWLQRCQSLEYVRYARQVEQSHRVMVLTGTAALLRREALHQVAQARAAGDLPGHGAFYDETSITEDGEMTLALKTCGWRLASPRQCRTTTELMGTVADLHRQRVRWYRGALDNLRDYGLTKTTALYWGQQVTLALGALIFVLYLLLTVVDALRGALAVSWFWSLVGVAFAVERAFTARRAGLRNVLLAAALLPEMVYNLLLQRAYAVAVWRHLRRGVPEWHHAAGVRSRA